MVNETRIIEEFSRQAQISSPSYREAEMGRYLEQRFRALGGEVRFDRAGEQVGGEVGNLVANFPASGKQSKPLLLSVHMDTVSPCEGVSPVLRDGVFYSAGETVLGADDKAGIVEIIEALEVVQELGIPHGPLEVVVTICEEVGLVGAKHLDLSLVKAKRCLALDTNGVDRLIHRAPGANKLRFEITGRDAHAGIAPERGVSAIEVAAHAIAALDLGRIDKETTANIGTIQGGVATNIVPRSVLLEGEVRSHDAGKLRQQTETMQKSFQTAAAELSRQIDGETVTAYVDCQVLADYPIMLVPKAAGIVRLVEAAAEGLGRPLEVAMAGGGSDANIFNQHGIETVILGTGMTGVHTVDESVAVADMARVASLLVEVIRRA
jgi:tripeptide aminopeptidase